MPAVAIGLLVLIGGVAWFIFSMKSQESAQVLDATIDRDCAPWDGSAFTISIPVKEGISESAIEISIWRSPDMERPVVFSFPDQTGMSGNAIYRPQFGSPEQLNGGVFFWRVDQENPVEGEFNFTSGRGRQLNGRFKAEWGNQMAVCG
jgi:hypothetical protein